MTQNLIDCPSPETFENTQASELVRMRYDLIVRARREISAGRYDRDAEVDRMLDTCMDRLLSDVQSA